MKLNSLIFLSTLLLTTMTSAQEQKPKEGKAPVKERRVQVRFEDELIKGSADKPDLSTLDTKTTFNYKRLIRVRENFVNEMEDGLDDFKGK